jgi:hypothetical protein
VSIDLRTPATPADRVVLPGPVVPAPAAPSAPT